MAKYLRNGVLKISPTSLQVYRKLDKGQLGVTHIDAGPKYIAGLSGAFR